jgi:tetratricopeptide (TPR) repeat protein
MLAEMGGRAVEDGRQRGVAIDPAALKKARLDAGLSLARAAGDTMTKQALQLIEIGRNRPTRENLEVIVTRLGVPLKRVLACPADAREQEMANLEERQRFAELERLAGQVVDDRNTSARVRAIARYYRGRALASLKAAAAVGELRKARRQLVRVGLLSLAAQALEWEAGALYLIQNPDAIALGRQALSEYRQLPDRTPAIEARMLEHLGTYLLQHSRYEEAIASYREALQVSGGLLDLTRLALIYHGMAEASRRTGQGRQGLEYMERAISFYRSDCDIRGPITDNLARAENDYACQMMGVGNWMRAEEMIQAALDHSATAEAEATQSHALLSMGELHQRRGDLAAAMDWTCQAIDLAERHEAVVAIAAGYQQLGDLWAIQGEGERFEAAFTRAIEVLDAAGLTERRSEALTRYERLRTPDWKQAAARGA